jgi:hypothetical protein
LTLQTIIMKKTLLLVCLLCISLAGFSQLNGNYNYTIAVRGLSVLQMPKLLNQANSNQYYNTFFSGAMIKFNDNQISYRLNGSYFKNNKVFPNVCTSCELALGKVTDYSFKIGFEKSFNYARIQPYFAFDVGFRSNKYEGQTQNINSLKGSSGTVSDVESSKDGLVASPIFGIKINPLKEISIFAESNLEFFYFYERTETVSQDANNTRALTKYRKSEFLLNPVSVGIQVHLGNRN